MAEEHNLNHNNEEHCCGHEHGEGCCSHEHHHHEHDDCCCGHEHEHQFMTLVLDDDTEMECAVIGIFDVDDKSYIALLPTGEEEVMLYRYIEEDDENFSLENIEDDTEFENVENVFFELMESEDEEEDGE